MINNNRLAICLYTDGNLSIENYDKTKQKLIETYLTNNIIIISSDKTKLMITNLITLETTSI